MIGVARVALVVSRPFLPQSTVYGNGSSREGPVAVNALVTTVGAVRNCRGVLARRPGAKAREFLEDLTDPEERDVAMLKKIVVMEHS